jgi:hypothetical protein
MPTLDNKQRLAVLVKNAPSTTLHLIVGKRGGILFFACEQAAVLTFQSHGLPSRCPVCSDQNPLRGKRCANDAKDLLGPQA